MIELLIAGLLSGQAAAGPQWAERPSDADIQRAFPTEAMRRGRGGRAVLACELDAAGTPRGCRVEAEDPPGLGFGAAALTMAPQFRFRQLMADGRSVAGERVYVPIVWSVPAGGTGSTYDETVITDPVWIAAPSRAEVAAARPAGVAGAVTLRCQVRDDGALRGCRPLQEAARFNGLGEAARRLADRFRLAGRGAGGAQVDVPVRFGETPAAYLRTPQWMAAPTAAEVQAAFRPVLPTEGEREASATVDCAVGEGGRLRDCRPLRASSDAAGAAAATLAGRFSVRPWSAEGEPAVGARVRLPLRYRDG